ncbi:hypothetical protein [Streptomyces sp. NPDC048425]|uniref:hypothetical protein n=1 Tax=Streptomyces sp. NPDC048425 TaxID=3365548 RepID=UPI0037152369
MEISRMYRRRLVPAVAAMAAAVALLTPSSLAQAKSLASGKVEFAYTAPEISEDGSSVTWHWTVSNTGDTTVDQVVMTHKLTPQLQVAQVSAPCQVQATAIRCGYGAMKPDEKREGSLVADLPEDLSGSVQINGRITWQARP